MNACREHYSASGTWRFHRYISKILPLCSLLLRFKKIKGISINAVFSDPLLSSCHS